MPADHSLGWCRLASRYDLTPIPIDSICDFPLDLSIIRERLPGADASGYAGLEDRGDYHWWDLMKAAVLSTLLAAGTELAMCDEDRLVRAIRDGARDAVNQPGQQIVQRRLQIAPRSRSGRVSRSGSS